MKAHDGVDVANGLFHTVVRTAGHVANMTQAQLFTLFASANMLLARRSSGRQNTRVGAWVHKVKEVPRESIVSPVSPAH